MHEPRHPAHAAATPCAEPASDPPPAPSSRPTQPLSRPRPGEVRRRLCGAGVVLPSPDTIPHRAPANDNGVDADKVAMLRAAIARGRFRCDARVIAERILGTR